MEALYQQKDLVVNRPRHRCDGRIMHVGLQFGEPQC